jgi:hypothetical protein
MEEIQKRIAEKKIRDLQEQERLKQAEAARKQRELDQQKLRDQQRMERNVILQALEQEKVNKARQIVSQMAQKGYKKIGKDKIKDLEANPDKIDYDSVIEFYQGVIKKEREQIEEDKKKKLREVELWNRALREEEKIAIEKYAQQNGEKEMEQIQQSILAKKQKELNERKALESAKSVLNSYLEKQMGIRHAQWEDKKKAFMQKKMEEMKQSILAYANTELMKDESRRKTEEMMKKRAERDRLIREQEAKKAQEGGQPAVEITEE